MSKYDAVASHWAAGGTRDVNNEEFNTLVRENHQGGVRTLCSCGSRSAERIMKALILLDEMEQPKSGFDWDAFARMRKVPSGLYD